MSNQRRQRFIRISSVAAFLFLLPIVGAPAQASHNPPSEQTEPAPEEGAEEPSCEPAPEEGTAAPEEGAEEPSCEPSEAEEPSCDPFREFDPADFPVAANVDNPWLPLIPGNQLVLEGTAQRDAGTPPHRVIFTVTDLTKTIEGVPTRVMWGLDIDEGRVTEAKLAFFAQDVEGNVWNLGEYPEEYEEEIFTGYEEEVFIGAPDAWIHGVDDAEGGIYMKGVPEVSSAEYLLRSVPSIEVLDCAKVVSMDSPLRTQERDPADPEGGIQTKAHTQGVGIVELGAINDPEGETLVLLHNQRLGRRAMALVNREALRMDKRAYGVTGVYEETKPIDPPDEGASVRLRRGPGAQRAAARLQRGGLLKGGKAAWCARALGRRLCKRWATTGSPIPGGGVLREEKGRRDGER